MAEPCPYHIDHENRMKCLEADMKDVQSRLGNPAVMVALIGLIGVLSTAVTSFLAVVFAPVVRGWFGV